MSGPLISIIMPVKNASPWLEACLQSLLAQSEQHWELLAVDDHSSDDSARIVAACAALDPRIRPLASQGRGIIAALQTGFAASRGQLISRMDADDLMPPAKLAGLKQILLARGPGHVATGLVKYFADGQLGAGFLRYEHWLNSLTTGESNFSDIYRECPIASPAWLIFRQDFEAAGAFDSDTYPEDYDLVFRFYRQGLRIAACRQVVHLWRDHGARSSRNDPNYLDYRFLDLKLGYFLQLEKTDNLVLWGAGKKGKELARKLVELKQQFVWLTNNPRKTGSQIHGQTLQSSEQAGQLANARIMIAVASPGEQAEIAAQLAAQGLAAGREFFFFA